MKRFLVALALCLLCVSLTPAVLAESGDGSSLADAELIPETSMGRPLTLYFGGNIYYPGQHWYRIEAPQDGTFYITLRGTKSGVGMEVTDERGSKIISYGYGYTNQNQTKTQRIQVSKYENLYLKLQSAGEFELGVCFGNHHTAGRVSSVKEQPTCTTEGVITYACTLCQQPAKTELTPALGHTWTRSDYVWPTGLVYDQPATCTKDGVAHYVCGDCGASSETTTIPHFDGANSPWGHMWERSDYVWPDGLVIDRQPTCVMDGHAYYQCKDCGYKLETGIGHYDGKNTPWGHIWERPNYVWPEGMKIIRQPTATRDGYGYYLCPDCQYMLEFTIPKLGR